jgi:hypothetical protein
MKGMLRRMDNIGSALIDYVYFTFISLPLAIVRINCTIVRVIEPQRLLVVLSNKISKGMYLILKKKIKVKFVELKLQQ